MYVQSTATTLDTSADGVVWDNSIQRSQITNIEGQFNVANVNGSNPSMPLNRVNSSFIYVHKNNRQALIFDLNTQIVNKTTGQTYTSSQADYETFLAWLKALI